MDPQTLLTKRFVPKASLVARKIVDDVIIVPVRKRAKDVDNIYSINATGARIWELMDGTRSLDQIVLKITAEYEIDELTALQDTVEFVTKLLTIDALDEV